jgi:hypothetical protein
MRNSFHIVFMSDTNEIIREMNSLVSSYIECWEKGENRFISPTQPTGIDSQNILLADNLTDCEIKYSLFIKLDEQNRRLAWRYRLEDMPFEVVVRLPVLLTRSLKAQSVYFDHRVLWSWIAQLSTNLSTIRAVQDAVLNDDELMESFKLLVRLELASLGKPSVNPDIDRLNEIIDAAISWHVRMIVYDKHILALTFSFPVLERLLRQKCSSLVDLKGTAKQDFSVQGRGYSTGKRISSVADLLYLYEEKVAPKDVRELLIDFRSELLKIFPSESDAYNLLYSWRNDVLHGAKLHRTYHAVVLNLISLLLLDSLEQIYETLRSSPVKHSDTRFQARTPWDFYPPELF